MTVSGKSFQAVNTRLTNRIVAELGNTTRHSAVIAEAPPGAGKSTLTSSIANGLVTHDRTLRLPIVTQTNEQADDLALRLIDSFPKLRVARLVSSTSGPSQAVLARANDLSIVQKSDDLNGLKAQIIVGTARKWQFERARRQETGINPYPFALIDEAYQMRSDALLGIADLFETLFCVGDPGQLDPFTTVDDSAWKGLPYSPSRSALAVLRSYHQSIDPIRLDVSWRLPPSASGIVSSAFYPENSFGAGTSRSDRALQLGKARRKQDFAHFDPRAALTKAARLGWAYVELPAKHTVRTDREIAESLAALVANLLDHPVTVVDEMKPSGRALTPARVAVIAAHNDQVHAVRFAVQAAGIDPDSLVISTANKIQGREYDIAFVWHPLAGRRDATAFHLEAGRMCVMLSRHRQACVVVGRAGAEDLLAEFPDSDPIFLDEPEKFPDGWQANYEVLEFLREARV